MANKFLSSINLTAGLEDKDGDLGTSGQVLVSTGSQVNWADSSTVIGGPYLPLSAGASYPLTDTLTINNGFSGPDAEAGYRLKFYNNGGIHNDPGIGLDGTAGAEKMWFNALEGYYWNSGTLGVKMTLTNAGNLGIGTTAPGAKLDVAKGSEGLYFQREGIQLVLGH